MTQHWKRLTRQLPIAWLCAASSLPVAAQAQSAAPPPTALPVHSALPEDARTTTGLTPPSGAGFSSPPLLAAIPPPSSDAPDFIPVPPYATPQSSLPTWPEEPPPAPAFSWKPTFIPKGAKSGSFQASLFRTTYLPRLSNASGFGMTDVNKQFTFAVPPFFYGSPILITPSVTSHFLDGPGMIDLPSEIYDFELEFRYMKQITGRWGIDTSIAPSYFGDLKNDSSAAWRLTGRAISAWDWSPTVKLVGGALFLGREDIPISPVIGAIWKPNADWRYDILIPRPRVYRRIYVCDEIEQRVYLGGEFGGNSWAIDRAGGIADKFTYSDLRLALGWERTAPGSLNGRVELGWVFNRKISYESGIPGFKPNDTVMLRGELSF